MYTKYCIYILLCQLFLFIGFSKDIFASETNSLLEVNGKIGSLYGNNLPIESENINPIPKREIQIKVSAQNKQLKLPQTGSLSEYWTIIFGVLLLLVYCLLKVKNKQNSILNPKFN